MKWNAVCYVYRKWDMGIDYTHQYTQCTVERKAGKQMEVESGRSNLLDVSGRTEYRVILASSLISSSAILIPMLTSYKYLESRI